MVSMSAPSLTSPPQRSQMTPLNLEELYLPQPHLWRRFRTQTSGASCVIVPNSCRPPERWLTSPALGKGFSAMTAAVNFAEASPSRFQAAPSGQTNLPGYLTSR